MRLTSGRLLLLGSLAAIAEQEARIAFGPFPHEVPPRWSEDGTRRVLQAQRCEPTHWDRHGDPVDGVEGCATCAIYATERAEWLGCVASVVRELEAGQAIKAQAAIERFVRTPSGARCVAARRLSWALLGILYKHLSTESVDDVFEHVASWSTEPPQVGTLAPLQIIGRRSDVGGI